LQGTVFRLCEPEKGDIGTIVKILNSGYGRAQIAEYRGPLGPKGARTEMQIKYPARGEEKKKRRKEEKVSGPFNLDN
jgi:hypothetical protein